MNIHSRDETEAQTQSVVLNISAELIIIMVQNKISSFKMTSTDSFDCSFDGSSSFLMRAVF